MSEDSVVDIIIITYHTGNILFECINNVLNLKKLNKIILINNGNPPAIEEKITSLVQSTDKITLISGHGNVGFAKGCNMGALNSTADFLLFLNPDCIISDNDILCKFINVLKYDNYKVATCTILNNDGSIQKTCRRNLLTPLIAISESLNLYKFKSLVALLQCKPLNLPIEDIEHLPNISEVPALSGAVIFTTKQYYQEIKGMDESYFLHVEDMDFCMRIHQKGDKIAFVKNALVTHLLSTSNVTNKFLEYYKAQGFIIYIQKFFLQFNNILLGNCFKFLVYLRYVIKSKYK